MPSIVGSSCLGEDVIAAFVGGFLDERDVAAVDRHLAHCGNCLWLVTAAAVGSRNDPELRSHSPTAPAIPAAPPQRFERRQLIAQGGMGAVYYGVDRETGAPVAIKRLRPDLALTQSSLLGRFIREAEILRRLDHPNIVKMIASSVDGDAHEIVMEYVSGGSLRRLLKTERRLPVARAVSIVLELTDALSRAHHLGVIHRDIKPENVLLAPDGTPKLGDFGLAMLVGHESSLTNAVLGTMAYLSPEALAGQPVDARTDLWAIGVLLFEMVTGRRPFEASNATALATAITTQAAPDLEALCPEAPVAFVDLVYRLLEKDKAQRLGSARQLGAELEALARQPLEPSAKHVDHPPRSVSLPTGNVSAVSTLQLPASTTPFVGREPELAELCQLLGQRDVRVVTIIGPGGMGKSRLALELGRRIASGFGAVCDAIPTSQRPVRGVFLVDLAPLPSSDLLVPAVAEALGFPFAPSADPKRQLLDYLREKQLLLIMDNFEHLIAGASFLNELLQAAAGVKVLATSRERLGLRSETQFMLSGLSLPEEEAAADALRFSAVELFVDAARRAKFGFDPSEEDARVIVHICRLVHGMPLGIVLAASWLDTLSLPEVAAEIERSLDFLQSEAGDLPPRQQSIRAVFEHSWALLAEPERAALAAASVFRGGFTHSSADHVARASLRTLASLVAKSLLRRVPETGRYEIHELLREYAHAKLLGTPAEHAAAMDRLAEHYSAFLSERSGRVLGPARRETFSEIQLELDNIRVALKWMLDNAQAQRIAPALHPLGLFYHSRRSRPEAEALFAGMVEALAAAGVSGSPAGRKALSLCLIYQAIFCDEQGHKAAAAELARRSVATLSGAERDYDYAVILAIYASLAAGIDAPEELLPKLEEGIAVSRSLGDDWWRVRVLTCSCRAYMRAARDLPRAEAVMREAVALQKRLGHGTIAFPDSLGILGMLRYSQGYRREGCELVLESLRLAESAGDAWALLLDLQVAARAHRDLGDYPAAERFARRCIEHARELGSWETLAWCHLTLGSILRAQGRFEEAAQAYSDGVAHGGGSRALLAKAQLGLGELALDQREYRKAEQLLNESLATSEEQRLATGVRDALEALGYLACEEGQHAAASSYFRRAFAASRRERPAELIGGVVGIAWLCAKSGDPTRAAERASLARHHPATGHPILVRRIEPLFADLRRSLGEADLAAAIERGEQAKLERVFEEAFS